MNDTQVVKVTQEDAIIMHSITRLRFWTSIVLFIAATASEMRAQTGVRPTGSGRWNDPFLISQLEHLAWMSTNRFKGFEWFPELPLFSVVNDIDASATTNWNGGAGFLPMGSPPNSSFYGIIRGNGKTIRHLYINRPEAEKVGLIGSLSGGSHIRNLHLVGATIIGSNAVGGDRGICRRLQSVGVFGLRNNFRRGTGRRFGG